MEGGEEKAGAVAVVVQQNGDGSNEIERSKIGIMRAIVEREDPSAKVEFDCFNCVFVLMLWVLLRFLHLGFVSFC